MAVQDIYANITQDLMRLPGAPDGPPRFGMASQPTAMIQPQPSQTTSQELGLGTGQQGALTNSFAAQNASLGSIEAAPASGSHGDGHGAVSHPKAKSKPKEEKLGFWGSVKALGLGLISPITGIFTNGLGNFFKSAALIAGAGLLIIATGGAATPFLIAAGATMGTYQVGKGVVDYNNADTAEEKYDALHGLAAGVGCVAASVYAAGNMPGAPAAVAGESTLGTVGRSFGNLGRAFTEIPNSVRGSYRAFAEVNPTTGMSYARGNLASAWDNSGNVAGVLRGLGEPGRPPRPPQGNPPPPQFAAPPAQPAAAAGAPPPVRPTWLERREQAGYRAEFKHHQAQQAGGNIAPGAAGSAEYQTRLENFAQGLQYLDTVAPGFRGQFPNMLGVNESGTQFFGDIATA
ncbi:MAG: hypothetical protein QE263_08845 [Vampirovibrionales bacterium]|nr:hypothetical protein [Vampirovibrionales bacterium]